MFAEGSRLRILLAPVRFTVTQKERYFAGGQPLSNTTHDAFDPKRSYGKYGTLEREKGASAADCFKEFT